MKASELITLLQDAIDKYGDLPVTNDFGNLFYVNICNEDGYYIDHPDQRENIDKTPYEIYIEFN